MKSIFVFPAIREHHKFDKARVYSGIAIINMDSRECESVSALPQVELVGRVKLIDLSAVRDVWVLSADEDAELQRPVGPHHDKYHQ